MDNGEPNFKPFPTLKFWALKLSFTLPTSLFGSGGEVGIHFPFPKQSLQSLWEAFVAPIDYFIPNSEYWPYVDESDGVIKQGVMFDPVRKFGILSNLPRAIVWTSIILAIIAVLEKIGLISMASRFASNVFGYLKNRKLYNEINDLDNSLNNLDEEVDAITLKVDNLTDRVKVVESQMGLRMVFQ